MADVDVARVLILADQLREQPERQRVSDVLARRSQGIAWLSGVPAAGEAVLDVMRQMLGADEGEVSWPRSDSPIQLASSAIESPSALLAFRSVFPCAESHPQEAGEPDPRARLYPGEGVVVWRHEGLRAVPAVAPPSVAAAEQVRALAVPGWPHVPAAYQGAAGLAGVPVADLLGVLVHPPSPPQSEAADVLRRHPDVWVRSVQAVACLGIAHHGTSQPWPGSERRRILAELFYGPEDWVTEAAGFALVAQAWMDPDARREVGGLVRDRWTTALEAVRTREVSILRSLTQLALACPWLELPVTSFAREMLTMIEHAAQEPPPAELAEHGAQLADVAESRAAAPPPPRKRRLGFRPCPRGAAPPPTSAAGEQEDLRKGPGLRGRPADPA